MNLIHKDKSYIFSKDERLCSKKAIDRLFSNGKSFISYPLRVVYCMNDIDLDNSILVSVPKRKFKRAVKRNRIKRLIKEAYRLNKSELSKISIQYNLGFDIAFLYIGDQLSDFETIQNAVLKAFSILTIKIDESEPK